MLNFSIKNTTIINKGLYTENKKCDLYNPLDNEGNGMIFCEPKDNLSNLTKNGEIILDANGIIYIMDRSPKIGSFRWTERFII